MGDTGYVDLSIVMLLVQHHKVYVADIVPEKVGFIKTVVAIKRAVARRNPALKN